MRTSDTFPGTAFEEVRIVFAPYKLAGILINRISHFDVAQIRQSDEARHVGIVHQQLIAEAVYLESINLTVFRMVADSIFL